MIGLIILIGIGKYYYELGKRIGKNGVLFILLGIVVYYASAFAFGIVLGLADVIFGSNMIDGSSDAALGLMGVPVGILGCWGVYKWIERSNAGKEAEEVTDSEIQEFGTKEEDQNFESTS